MVIILLLMYEDMLDDYQHVCFILSVQPVDWEKVEESVKGAESDKPIAWAQGGTRAGLSMLESFCKDRLKTFHGERNNPTKTTLSDLSPWFHFGKWIIIYQYFIDLD